MLSRAKNFVIDMLFPPVCLTCPKMLVGEEKGRASCEACIASVPLYEALICPACRSRVPLGATACHPEAKYLLSAAAHYENPVMQTLVRQLKYKGWMTAGERVGSLMVRHLHATGYDFASYSLVPVPLHKWREWDRGFNQAHILARHLGTSFTLPVIRDNLGRMKKTDSQADQKDYTARETNMAGAFHAARPEEFKGKNILLVDDVSTSGATLGEAVRVLKACGAKKIIATVAARAR